MSENPNKGHRVAQFRNSKPALQDHINECLEFAKNECNEILNRDSACSVLMEKNQEMLDQLHQNRISLRSSLNAVKDHVTGVKRHMECNNRKLLTEMEITEDVMTKLLKQIK